VKIYSCLVVSGCSRNELNWCGLQTRCLFYEIRSLFPFCDHYRCPFCESYRVRCEKCKAFRDVWKIVKSDYSFVISVSLRFHPSAVPTGRIFMKFNSWEIFENLSREFKFWLNRETLGANLRTGMITSRSVFLRMRNVLENLRWKWKHTFYVQ